MSAFIAEVAGDGLEVLGVFFLSVEAIRLENLYKLRDRLLLPLEHGLQAGTFEPQKTEWTFAELRRDHLALRHFFLSHYGAGCGLLTGLLLFGCYLSRSVSSLFFGLVTRPIAISLVVLFLLLPVVLALLATSKGSLLPPIIVMFIMALAIIPIGIVPMSLGEAAHQGSRSGIRAILRALEFIARETPTGTIGILGFAAVCVGKIVQLFAGSVQH